MNSRTIMVGLAAAAALVVAVGVFWFGRESGTKPPPPGDVPRASTDTTSVRTSLSPSLHPPRPLADAASNSAVATGSPATDADALPGVSTQMNDWEQRVDEALKSGAEDKEVAKRLLTMFPRMPVEGQVEAVQHISNLLPDEDYPELGKHMEDAKLPEEVLDQLMLDLLNRPNKIMLPELLKVARNADHPKASEAKDYLELHLEDDYGTDWNLWQTKVTEWLAANPE